MDKKQSVERKVYEILKSCKASRYDDMILTLQYYNRYGDNAGKKTLEELVFGYKKMGLPGFNTISRARQRVQSIIPELSRAEKDNTEVVFVILE